MDKFTEKTLECERKYTGMGYCEERIHIHFAELADGQHAQDQDPDENVFPVVLTEDEVAPRRLPCPRIRNQRRRL